MRESKARAFLSLRHANQYPWRQVLTPPNSAGDTKSRAHTFTEPLLSLFFYRVSLKGPSTEYAVIRYRAGEKLKVKHIVARKGELRACVFKACVVFRGIACADCKVSRRDTD